MDPKSCFRRFFAYFSALHWLAIGGICVWLAACSSTTPAPKEEAAELQVLIVVSRSVNPDDSGRAAPIMVRLYELKSATAFQSADFFTLHDDDRKAAGADVLAVDEFILRPGGTETIRRKANPSTKAIGVLAAYRDLGKSVWRDVYVLRQPPKAPWYRRMFASKKKETLQVSVDRQAVSISVRRGDKWVSQSESGG